VHNRKLCCILGNSPWKFSSPRRLDAKAKEKLERGKKHFSLNSDKLQAAQERRRKSKERIIESRTEHFRREEEQQKLILSLLLWMQFANAMHRSGSEGGNIIISLMSCIGNKNSSRVDSKCLVILHSLAPTPLCFFQINFPFPLVEQEICHSICSRVEAFFLHC
jgi:hypothetical protein